MKRIKHLFSDKFSTWILISCLIISGILSYWSYISTSNKHKNKLINVSEQLIDSIKGRLTKHENSLIQLRAHLITSSEVTRDSYKKYVASLMLNERYPGVQGLGYTIKVPKDQLHNYQQSVRKEGFPTFKVWPEDPREEYFSIHFLEPFDWRNQRAFGFDMYSEETRREAMARARDTAAPTMTKMVKLVQETNEAPQPGFLIYVPIYNHDFLPATLAERRSLLRGFAYAPFRANDFFAAIFARDQALMQEVEFEVFDNAPLESNRIFNNNDLLTNGTTKDLAYSQLQSFEVLGQKWFMHIRLRSNSNLYYERLMPYLIAIIGLVLSFLIFWTIYSTRAHYVQMKKSQFDLKQALMGRDEFLSLASHELKTPLTSLSLKSQYLERLMSKEEVDKDVVINFISFVQAQITRLAKLVDDLLDVSRISSGNFKLLKEPFDFCSMVHDVIDRLMPIFKREGITGPNFKSCPEAIGTWDMVRMEQVVTNLLTNAIRYGQGNPIDLELRKEDNKLILSVRDRGIGIAQENLDKIFNRYERLLDKNAISGLGLGLYLSRKIVEAHQGKIWAVSEKGQGTTFFVELPLI
jgi:two-component system, OmpR family, sensor kinase